VSEVDGKVVDPAGGTARFHDDEIAFGFLEERGEVGAFGGGVDELVFSRFGVVNAAHGIELAEVESENDHQFCSLGLGLEF
jgi:hypothetical protein